MLRQILLVSADIEMILFFRAEFSQFVTINICSSLENVYVPSVVKYDALFISFDILYKNGFSAFQKIHPSHSECPIVVVSREDSSAFAVMSVRYGASDYIVFPFNSRQVDQILLTYILSPTSELSASESIEIKGFEQMLGISSQAIELKKRLNLAAKSNYPILLLGESGTGKSFAARLIHENSGRKDSCFFPLNSSVIPDSLIEAELFGTVVGAYTGAVNRCGCFEMSHKGTLFLDEIGEITLTMQVKLLQVIENKVFRRIGSTKEQSVDVRYVFATNADLQQKIAEGSFRRDLYYRISIISIVIPPLRERKEDIVVLAQHFLKPSSLQLDMAAQKKLLNYDWPGNIRELSNCIQRSCLGLKGSSITASDIQLF